MEQSLFDSLQTAFTAAIVLGAPILIITTIIGFVFAVFQAVTQIQDQTLPQVIKTIVVCIMVLFLSDSLTSPLVEFTAGLFVMPPVN